MFVMNLHTGAKRTGKYLQIDKNDTKQPIKHQIPAQKNMLKWFRDTLRDTFRDTFVLKKCEFRDTFNTFDPIRGETAKKGAKMH